MTKESKMNIGEKMPEIVGHDREMRDVKLPDSAAGHVTLVVLISRRGAQSMVDSWTAPFERELCEGKGYMCYEVPLISGMWGRFFSDATDDGMEEGIPSGKRQSIVTFYGDYGKVCKRLNISDKGVAHPMLLDRKGVIRWRDSGFSTDKKVKEMIGAARELNMEK